MEVDPRLRIGTTPASAAQMPPVHDAFSPQTPNSTTTVPTPSTAISIDHHSNHSNANSSSHHHHRPSFQADSPNSPDTAHNARSLPAGTATTNPTTSIRTASIDDSHYHDEHDESTTEAGPGDGLLNNNNPNNPNDPKKPRACESCRGLKVRCDPDPADPEGPCRRCVKAKRACVVTQPTRKRQKKTDSRVAELEKKIDALTASLHARATTSTGSGGSISSASGGGNGPVGGGVVPPPGGSAGWAGRGEQVGNNAGGIRGGDGGGVARGEDEAVRYSLPSPASGPLPPPSMMAMASSGAAMAGQKRKYDDRRVSGDEAGSVPVARDSVPGLSSMTPQPGGDATKEQPDIVERGLVSITLANELLMRYMSEMCPHLPGVVIPPGTTASDLRTSKPILFLAIMACASSELPMLQRALTQELMHVLAERIIVRGKKSLEVIQAIQVTVIWYWPPERFEDLKFYQLVHIAAVMAIEIGLGRKKTAKGGFRKHIACAWRDHPLRKQPPPDSTTIEARRAWLTCYFMATNTAMAMHRSNLIRWTPFMAESMDILETSPDAAPTDKYLCQLVWTHKLAEEVSNQFSMDDPASTPNIADPRTQYALRGFERELERCRSSIPRELQQPTLRMSFHVINLYMHEMVTHNDNGDDCKPSNGEALFGSDTPLTVSHINALSACLTAIDGIFDVFLTLDIKVVRCLPVFNFVRVAYAVVVLIKLYFAASSPNSELGMVINKDHMKVEQHLDNLLDKFRATAAEDKSRPAVKFLVVLVMIRSWFHKQKQSQDGGNNASTLPSYQYQSSVERNGSTPVPQQPRQPDYPAASTPLQLLSEIATNNSAAASMPGPGGSRPSTSADLLTTSTSATGQPPSTWLNRQPLIYDPTTPAPPPQPQHQQQQHHHQHQQNKQQQQQPQPQQPGTRTETPSPFVPSGITPQQQPTPIPASSLTQPWLNNNASAFPSSADFDFVYANLGDGFAEAMDWTLGGFLDGGLVMDYDVMPPPPQQQQQQHQQSGGGGGGNGGGSAGSSSGSGGGGGGGSGASSSAGAGAASAWFPPIVGVGMDPLSAAAAGTTGGVGFLP